MENSNIKYSYNHVKQSFEKEGYTLLSKEYKNNKQHLEYICPNGHKHKISFSAWLCGQRCGRCFGNIEVTYDQVKQSFEKEGYSLLSKEYIDAQEYLEYICPNGHKHKIIWNAWQRGQRCGICSGIHKLDFEFVKQSFEKEGYSLLSKEYIDAQEYLEYICPNGHKHRIKWGSWQQGVRCGKCHYVTYDHVKQSFENEGYTLLSKEYANNNSYLDFICPNGHKHRIKWGNWQQGQKCGKCSSNGISKPEKEILEYIKENYNGIIIPNDRSFIKNPKTGQYLELDIWLPELRKAIEYNGEYWHKFINRKKCDKIKQKWCKENNIDLLVINEENWNKNKDWNKINNFIKGV